jgi:hypothetical protein
MLNVPGELIARCKNIGECFTDFSSLGSALTSIVSNGAELTLSALLGGAVYAMTFKNG